MHSWNPHTVLLQNRVVCAYHITGLFDMLDGLFEYKKAFSGSSGCF